FRVASSVFLLTRNQPRVRNVRLFVGVPGGTMAWASLKCFPLALMLAPSPLVFAESGTPQPIEHASAFLDTGLRHKAADHRVEAVKALSLITGEKAATKAAFHALSDDNADVRTAAATTLGQLHAVSAIPELRKLLSDKETSVVLAASQALYQLR